MPVGPRMPSHPGPVGPLSPAIGACSRCFSRLHIRLVCSGRIRCSSCFRLGHIASLCRFPPRFRGLSKTPLFSNQINLSLWSQHDTSKWFAYTRSLPCGSDLVRVPVRSSLAALLTSATASQAAATASSPTWKAPEYPWSGIPPSNQAPQSTPPDLLLCLSDFPPTSPSASPARDPPPQPFPATRCSEKNPTATIATSPFPPCCEACVSTMPLRFVDPTPFIPHGFSRVMIPGRRTMTRAILGRQPRRSLDLAITIIQPMPNQKNLVHRYQKCTSRFLRRSLEGSL